MVYISFPISKKPSIEELKIPFTLTNSVIIIKYSDFRPLIESKQADSLISDISFESLIFTEKFTADQRVK